MQWLHRQAYLLHDIGITRHFMFSKPRCGETGPGSVHEAYDVLLRQNKSLLLRPDYPSAAMSASSVSQPSQQPLSWTFPLRWQFNASFFARYPRRVLMSKFGWGQTFGKKPTRCEALRMPSSQPKVELYQQSCFPGHLRIFNVFRKCAKCGYISYVNYLIKKRDQLDQHNQLRLSVVYSVTALSKH